MFLEMQRHFAHVGAEGISEDAARSWVRGLVSEERSALTVREVWLSASRRVFSWGMEHKHVQTNPFATIKVDVPKKAQTRETGKAFTPEETRTILRASSACENPKTPWERAKRWVPWLCAYSGARVLEQRFQSQRGVTPLLKINWPKNSPKTLSEQGADKGTKGEQGREIIEQ
jgi:site-specific recombinase XerD